MDKKLLPITFDDLTSSVTLDALQNNKPSGFKSNHNNLRFTVFLFLLFSLFFIKTNYYSNNTDSNPPSNYSQHLEKNYRIYLSHLENDYHIETASSKNLIKPDTPHEQIINSSDKQNISTLEELNSNNLLHNKLKNTNFSPQILSNEEINLVIKNIP